MSTLVAIPVYEREQRVKDCFSTIAEMVLPQGARIVIFDDCSCTFDPARLAEEMGLPAEYRQLFHVGPDAMIYLIWSAFIESGEDYLLMMDSDMIANRSALVDGLAIFEDFDGLLSLYNSIRHPPVGVSGELAHKTVLGNAGSLWNRDLVSLVRSKLEMGNFLDQRYSQFLRQQGIALASTARSRVQHLGVEGAHNRFFGDLEHGVGFIPDGLAQHRALAEAYDDLMSRQDFFLRR